jgi:hypothetical protein
MSAVFAEGTNTKSNKHSARLADGQIDHLEGILVGALGTHVMTAVRSLDLDYWTARINVIAVQFDLVPSQRSRLAALLRLLAVRESATAAAVPTQQNALGRVAA